MTEYAPVKYGEHAKVSPGTVCETCGSTKALPVTDHCHEHGWVRGLVCPRCNNLMAFVDRKVAPRVESALLAALVALRQRCPDCGRLDVGDLGSREAADPNDPNRNIRYPLTWPAWMYEMAGEAANERAMSVATWLREAALEKLERAGKGRPDPSGFEVVHKDGDPANSSPDNLELRERPR